LDKNGNRGCDRPVMTASNIHYEIADRTQATANRGIRAMHLLVRQLGLDQAIDAQLGLLKIHLPYHGSDHVLSYPVQVVCEWIGNTAAVAAKHYLQVTDEHYAKAVQNAVQYAPVLGGTARGQETRNPRIHRGIQGFTGVYRRSSGRTQTRTADLVLIRDAL
jgi:hypothetical protein